jgi:hypothetical protein
MIQDSLCFLETEVSSMGGRWESILVAISLIALFYLLRKYFQQKKPPLKTNKPQPIDTKKRGKAIQTMEKGKKGSRKVPLKNPLTATNHVASLVMHPHSLERAKKEFFHNAHRFRGSYEPLFLTCNSKTTGAFREQVLRKWEEGIRSTEAQNLILIWTTIVQKQCGRNFYRNSSLRSNRDAMLEHDILEAWLTQLLKWGVLRELKNQNSPPEHEGEFIQEVMKPRWTLNGEILEEGEERVKSLGH